ncbi:MAG: DMT family transporter [Thaumarchaeota archaeon]|nr:DMT family transporter [Nitrososphaerota archaeon]
MATSRLDFVLIFLMCSIWAGNYFVIDAILPYVDPFTLSFLRAVLGGLFVLAIGGRVMKGLGRADVKWLVAFGLFNTALFFVLLNASLLTASAGVDSTLIYTQPIFVVAFAPLLGERLTYRRVSGVAVAFCGVAVIFLPSILGSTVVIGDLYAVAGAVSWAVSVILFKRWKPKGDARAVQAVQSLIGGALIVPVLAVEKPFVDPTLQFWLLLVYSVVLATGLTYTFFLTLLARMPATQVTSYLFLVPVLATIMGSIITARVPAPNEVVGTALVAIGIVVVNR